MNSAVLWMIAKLLVILCKVQIIAHDLRVYDRQVDRIDKDLDILR